MSAANASTVLKYIEDKKAQYGNRAVCIPQNTIAMALGVPEQVVRSILESLKERGKVHETSRGTWCTGSGFGR
jgi:hypothetical protein